jgi:hypothetical protein
MDRPSPTRARTSSGTWSERVVSGGAALAFARIAVLSTALGRYGSRFNARGLASV